MATLSKESIEEIGFASVGEGVKISDRASIYGANRIALGDHVRIDDYCVLSAGKGGISIEEHVHIAVYSCLIGGGNITLRKYSNISSRVSIYSSNDDYSGVHMTNPTIPSEFTNVTHANVYLGKHVIVGSGSVILPGVKLEDGVAIGALSLVNISCSAFGIYAGTPIKRIGDRKRALLELERQFIQSKQ